MNTSKIITELSHPDFIDYEFLSQKSCLQAYPEILVKLLKQAEQNFKKILKLKENEVSFANLIEEYFQMDSALNILYGFIHSLNATNTTDQTRKIIEDFQPKVIDYYNKVAFSQEFYKLVKSLSKQKKLPTDQKRSIELILKDMELSGVHLPEPKRKELQELNKKLSKLAEKFENNVIDSRKNFFYAFEDKKSLEEMPENNLEAARAEAKLRKMKADYVFTLSPPSLQAIMKYCSDREVRELFYKKNSTIATEGKLDNRPIVIDILKLRAQKAKLVGCDNYVDYVLKQRMAKNAPQIQKLLMKIHKPALKKSQQELQELSTFSGVKKLEEWDMTYHSEKLSQKKFKVNEKELKEFFPLSKVTEGLFAIASKLFGLTLKETKEKSYDASVKVFKVFKDKELIAYYVADFFARPTKKGGAWCNDLRRGSVASNGESLVPIVINVMNFSEGNTKTESLLTHRDVETLFHEFGHALHVMLSSQTYPNLNGFNVEWDFVEFPSQLLENWTWEKEALALFAKHYKTKKTIPTEIVTKLQNSQTFMSGYKTLRQIEFAFLDLTLHQQKAFKTVKQLDDVCAKIVQKYSALKKFENYRMYASFDHIFAGGYAAGYYSYIWAEILEADCFLKMKKAGILKTSTGSEYAKKILSKGAKQSGKEIFEDFMGRSPDAAAYMKKHHFSK